VAARQPNILASVAVAVAVAKSVSASPSLLLIALLWICSTLLATLVLADDASCHFCHAKDAQGGIAHRAHGLGADPEGRQGTVSCTSCHGNSADHARNPGIKPEHSFAKEGDNLAAGDSTCLSCHNSAMNHWAFSEHNQAEIGCHSCHSIHTAEDQIQTRDGQFQACTSCHQRERAGQTQFSRHPLAEGHIQCTDCHAPHGGSAMSNFTQATLNDTCYQCHAEKRGPFLFEHEPVQDDCSHCHLPHASVHDSLLKAKQPFLCQQCHIASRHPGTLYDSERLGNRDINIVGQSCTNCHSQVHGGNHPASSTFRR